MGQEDFQVLLRFFKTLGNESRLKILGILANQECSVEELATLLKIKEPTVSHHLARLKRLNLVTMETDGNTHYYRLNPDGLQAINKDFFTQEQIATLADDIAFDYWERKVLNSFFEGERLLQIPASRKKRFVILKWLAGQFEMERRYPEKAVNEIIRRYHPDCATIRREFIANKLMARKQGIYWRLSEDTDY